ncbi:hypothetical protein ACFQV2_30445 [Actinokineospora soli]|uniref:MarR family transcriptional regulator n=1 Tax=Actinokineospora soli TaxID=1048753 RepID=A0ABW2TXC3_9PSEU
MNGQIIGQAERSTRAVLDRLLDDHATTFEQWVALNLAAGGGTREQITTRMTSALRLDKSTVDALFAGPLFADDTLTAAGRERYHRIADGVAAITERLYCGIPAEDLATAARVLTTVTERADAELA